MAAASLMFAAACALALWLLSVLPRWMQVVVIGAGLLGAGVLVAHAVIRLDGGVLLGALMLLAGLWGLDVILRDLRGQMNSPSGQAPGGAHAPGEAGERDGERHAPILPGVCTTAGRAGRPRSFSERVG